MRSPLGKEVRKLFAAELARRQPSFARVERPKPGIDPKWVYAVAPDLSFFIELHMLPRSDEFVVEVGWTDGGEIGLRDNYQSRVDTRAKKWGARLSTLVDETDGYKRHWDVTPQLSSEDEMERVEAISRGEKIPLTPPDPPVEEVLPRVAPLVRDAIDKLEKYALPLFRRVTEERGHKWPV